MNDPDRKPGDESSAHDPSVPAQSAGRRALLVAMPAIFSLHPGVAAAQARSSSVFVLAKDGLPDEDGNYLCARKPGLVDSNEKGWIIDRTTRIEIAEIPSDYRYARKTTNWKGQSTYTEVTPQEMCSSGGRYYYKKSSYRSFETEEVELFGASGGDKDGGDKGGDGKDSGGKGWQETRKTIYPGAFASAVALASFARGKRYNIVGI